VKVLIDTLFLFDRKAKKSPLAVLDWLRLRLRVRVRIRMDLDMNHANSFANTSKPPQRHPLSYSHSYPEKKKVLYGT
jgi:hypothetical protein